MSERLCLQWNDFQGKIKTAFQTLREDSNFADVTLACEDGHQVEAHKVVLAASSPFFQKLLGRNKHPHPLIYLRGMKSDDILAIVDFLYFGEAKVSQENLESFLAISEEFQLPGLMENLDEKVEDINEKNLPQPNLPVTNRKIPKNPKKEQSKRRTPKENKAVTIPKKISRDFQEFDESVKSMMEKSQNYLSYRKEKTCICKVCGKEGARNAIKDHIEAKHLEGTILPCWYCDKTFKTRNTLRQHKAKDHPTLLK